MKVFISSVTARLKDEREALAALLSLVEPYQPVRFEDFTARGQSPREACLAGARSCDVYVLLLGPIYGKTLSDSGLAPTEEEFTIARREGKPILVFVKETDEPWEEQQLAFKKRVEAYVDGRFRASFADPLSLNNAVLAALAGVKTTMEAGALQWKSVSLATTINWSWENSSLRVPGFSMPPLLEIRFIPLDNVIVPARRLADLSNELARQGRDLSFFEETDHISAETGPTAVQVWVPEPSSSGGAFEERKEHRFRGIVVERNGQVGVFEALPTDFMGALVDDGELRRRSGSLLRVAAEQIKKLSGDIVVAATLGPLDQVFEGDPSKVGGRNRGSMRMSQGQRALMAPEQAVGVLDVVNQQAAICEEIAASLIASVRAARQ